MSFLRRATCSYSPWCLMQHNRPYVDPGEWSCRRLLAQQTKQLASNVVQAVAVGEVHMSGVMTQPSSRTTDSTCCPAGAPGGAQQAAGVDDGPGREAGRDRGGEPLRGAHAHQPAGASRHRACAARCAHLQCLLPAAPACSTIARACQGS